MDEKSQTRGYYGTVRYGITVRFDFGKKYDTELRTEFLGKVRYGMEIRYYIFRTVLNTFCTLVMHALHFCFQVLHFSFLALFLLAYNFTTSVALAAHHQ